MKRISEIMVGRAKPVKVKIPNNSRSPYTILPFISPRGMYVYWDNEGWVGGCSGFIVAEEISEGDE